MSTNWDDLERWLERQQLPKGMDILKEPDWVERFVRNMMTKSLPEAAGVMGRNHNAEISVKGDFVHIEWKLPSTCEPDRLTLHVTERKVRLGGLKGGNKVDIKLPCLVIPRQCRAHSANGLLHIKLRKRRSRTAAFQHGIDWR
ncbi:Hsp20/alpha crystallin family protein [Paenibacillus sp. CAU 1782]